MNPKVVVRFGQSSTSTGTLRSVLIRGTRWLNSAGSGCESMVRSCTYQYSAMISVVHPGCTTSDLGRNSFITGLTSMIGVPSIASRPLTVILRLSTAITSQIVAPILFGRFFPRCASMPISGQAGFPLGLRASYWTLLRSTRSNTKRTSICENSSMPCVAEVPRTFGSSTSTDCSLSQLSSIGSVLVD